MVIESGVKAAAAEAKAKAELERLEREDEGGSIEFTSATVVEPAAIVNLIQSDPQCYSLSGSGKLRVKKALPTLLSRAEFLENLMSPWLEAA